MLTFDIISCNTSIQHFFQQGLIHRAIQKKRAKLGEDWGSAQEVMIKPLAAGLAKLFGLTYLIERLTASPSEALDAKPFFYPPAAQH